jgi:signal transduction histidine kinase/GAF domain-containing protein
VARIVSNVRGSHTDYAHLASELAPAFPFDLFGVVLLRHDRQAVRVIACTREAGAWVAHYHQHPLAGSMLERFLSQAAEGDADGTPSTPVEQSEMPAAASDQAEPDLVVQTYPGGLDGPPAECGDALSGHPQLRATLIAPLHVGGRVLGTLELGSADSQAYADASRLRIIHAVSQVLAAAIESAQVGGSVAIQDRQRQELQKVSSALVSTMDLPAILRHIVDGIAKALNVASAIVMLERPANQLRLEAQHGMDTARLGAMMHGKQMLGEASIIGATLRRRQPHVSNDISQDEHFPASHVLASELGMRSIFCYPLVAGSTVFGALLLLSPEPGGFTPLKADILSLFASQATIAIHHGMLLESARQRQRFQNAIRRLERAYPQELTIEEELLLLKKVREETERNFNISFSTLLRFLSEHLLTRSEGDLQSIFWTSDEATLLASRRDASMGTVPGVEGSEGEQAAAMHEADEDAAMLMRTAGVALERAGLLGDVGAALTATHDAGNALASGAAQGRAAAFPRLYEQVTRHMQDPWFIVDLHGQCIYMNPAAESLCGMRLDLDTAGGLSTPLRLRDALATLIPRIRNMSEVLAYLQEFERPDIVEMLVGEPVKRLVESNGDGADGAGLPHLNPLPAYTLRCVIAAEEVHPAHFDGAGDGSDLTHHTGDGHGSLSRLLTLDNAPSDRHYQLMRYALYDAHEELIAHVLQIHDITDQVRDERNKSALLSSVSHDLRTPLTAIKAAVSGLLQPGIEWDERVRHEMLVDIDEEADHLHRLINSMVEMSRIEMGALALEREWCDLLEIAHGAIASIQRANGEMRIETDFEGQLPLVFVDYLQMKRVFVNLLENAVRYNPREQPILVKARSFSLDASGDSARESTSRYVHVAVIDHGKGVPEEERERIFKSFYSRDGHTGLGLAICRGIVEAHQGRIWVERASDGGACFIFVLPVSV